MDGEIAFLLLQDGVANGAIYALAAVGLVLVFSVTRVVFVPFGDISAYAALTLAALQDGKLPGTVWLIATLAVIATLMDVVTLIYRGMPHRIPRAIVWYTLVPLMPVAMTLALAGRPLAPSVEIAMTLGLVLPIGPLLYRIAFRPIANAPVLLLLIVAVALHFAISGLALLFFGPEGMRTRSMFSGSLSLGSTSIGNQTLLIIATSAAFNVLLFIFFRRALMGKALRATAINRTGARIVGIRPAMTGAVAFTLAAAIAGISGILIGPVTTMYYDSGFLLGLKAFIGAIIGGLVSYPLAALGAVFVGVLESYASFWNSALKEVVVFTVLIPALVWRSLVTPPAEEEDEEQIEA